ncbi:carbohydrate-binding module family 13 protein [Coprinopsis sp. MPI-PUGE-AT-0042]|nr:carbohydrate-binding module family 13 protein [Coprinopsis sp. MPI-PUGE-AT-0042]
MFKSSIVLALSAQLLGAYASLIHSSLARSRGVEKCLDVAGNRLNGFIANGTAVQIFNCMEGSKFQNWVINNGSTKVQLAGTQFCLDAGSAPANGVGLKVWQCYDALPAQQWYFTTDNRIALEGQGLCVDLPNGDITNGIQLQTWQCTDNNMNQEFLL